MPIDLYMIKYSLPSRAVLMTARHLNIDVNIKTVDLSQGEQHNPEYKKINPCGTVPAINDNGFILWESRAIMQYLCNKYAPDSTLYPKDPKERALVDRWLNFDMNLFSLMKEALGKTIFTGIPASEQAMKAFTDNLKLLDQLIGDNKYLVSNHLTIADLSVLQSTLFLVSNETYLSDYPNWNRWRTQLVSELPYFNEINNIEQDEITEFINRMKENMAKRSAK